MVDKGRDDKTSTRYAFAIEPIDQVAERMGGREYSPKVMQSRLLNEDQEALFYMFQYMVGNTDWAVANSHNINAVTDTLTKSIIMLPYDYDYSGLVGTTYAVPHESVPIDNVADRYNKGFCISEELAEKYRLMFLEKQEEIKTYVETFPYFDRKRGESVWNYLRPFFDLMENPKKTKTTFCQNCTIPEN